MTHVSAKKNNQFIWSIKVILISLILLYVGGIPFLGPMLVYLAPNFLLFGTAYALTCALRSISKKTIPFVPVFFLSLLICGLNTRIPAVFHDWLIVNWKVEHTAYRPIVNLSQAIQVHHNNETVAARTFAYASARPNCQSEGCFTTAGYRTPYPHLENEYWSEAPKETILDLGLTVANKDEHTPVLTINTTKYGEFLSVSLKLDDADHKTISSATYVYRNGFAFEFDDDSQSGEYDNISVNQTINFMLHGNVINFLIGHMLERTTDHPIKNFLERSFEIHGLQYQIDQAKKVELEILAESKSNAIQAYAQINVNQNKKSKENIKIQKETESKSNSDCETLLKRESPNASGGLTQVWWIFVHDPSSRNKMRRTAHEFCNNQAIWSLDYSKRPSTLLAKYDMRGELQYQVIFENPKKINGFFGVVQENTFYEEDGYAYFQWAELKQSSFDSGIKNQYPARFLIPTATR